MTRTRCFRQAKLLLGIGPRCGRDGVDLDEEYHGDGVDLDEDDLRGDD